MSFIQYISLSSQDFLCYFQQITSKPRSLFTMSGSVSSNDFLILQSLDVSLRKMTLQLEEQLLLKLLQFFGYVQQDDDIAGSNEEQDECLYASQR